MEEMILDNKKNSEENFPRREIEPSPLETLQRTENLHNDLSKSWRYITDHPQEQIIGDLSQGVRTRRGTRETCEFTTFISQIELKSFEKVKKVES